MEYLENIKDYTDYIRDKKICLLGSGDSLNNYKIEFKNYDVIVGINRIYRTDIGQKLNVLYHNASPYDILYSKNKFAEDLAEKLKYIIFIPALRQTYRRFKEFHEFMLSNYNNKIIADLRFASLQSKKFKYKLLTGISALIHLILIEPKTIDIYGYDFYEKEYYNNLPNKPGKLKNHNIVENKKIFINIIKNSNNIKHFV